MFDNRINVPAFSKQLSRDITLDRDIKKIVSVMDFPQKCIFISQFNVQNNRLLPRQRSQNLRVCCFLLFINILCVYRIILFHEKQFDTKRMEFEFMALITAINYMTFCGLTTIIFCLEVTLHYEVSCLLILKLQNVHRYLGFNLKLDRIVLWNWIYIVIVFLATIIPTFFNYVTSSTIYIKDSITDGIADFVCIILDCKMIIGGRIVFLLKKYIDTWIEHVLITKKDDEIDGRYLKLFEVYRDILEAYQLCQKMYQILIFYHIFGAFYFGLYHISYAFSLIRTSEYKILALYQALVVIIWASKNIMLLVISCINCEKFYKAIEMANSVCLVLMQKENCSDGRKHLLKKVLKLNRSYGKMLILGVFCIDARLPLNFVEVFIHYVIVLLQFNFL